ncbi:MAG: preprotein translocase subunit YajC [Dehalococcoidales bacterium]|nr:preprotein translocase subunit YajC [Dehalococcoidales bacterium]
MAKVASLALVLLLALSLALMGGCAPTEGGDTTTSTIYMVVFMVLLFGVFYFLIIRPQRKKQREHQELAEGLSPGDRIITIGGIYGRIESVREDSVILKVESGATIRVARNGIAGKQEETS